MKVAKFLSERVSGSGAVQRHYDVGDGRYVLVSALDEAFDTGIPETYIFAADRDGDVIDWGELEGSYRGGTDHNKALRKAGYEVSR